MIDSAQWTLYSYICSHWEGQLCFWWFLSGYLAATVKLKHSNYCTILILHSLQQQQLHMYRTNDDAVCGLNSHNTTRSPVRSRSHMYIIFLARITVKDTAHFSDIKAVCEMTSSVSLNVKLSNITNSQNIYDSTWALHRWTTFQKLTPCVHTGMQLKKQNEY